MSETPVRLSAGLIEPTASPPSEQDRYEDASQIRGCDGDRRRGNDEVRASAAERRDAPVMTVQVQVDAVGLSEAGAGGVLSSGGTMGTTARSGMRVGSSLKAAGYASGLVFSSGSVERQWYRQVEQA